MVTVSTTQEGREKKKTDILSLFCLCLGSNQEVWFGTEALELCGRISELNEKGKGWRSSHNDVNSYVLPFLFFSSVSRGTVASFPCFHPHPFIFALVRLLVRVTHANVQLLKHICCLFVEIHLIFVLLLFLVRPSYAIFRPPPALFSSVGSECVLCCCCCCCCCSCQTISNVVLGSVPFLPSPPFRSRKSFRLFTRKRVRHYYYYYCYCYYCH